MSTLTLEIHEKDKPIILIAGNKNPLIKFLIDGYLKDFKVVLVSDSEIDAKKENFYRIRTQSSYLIKNLEEKIDYAVIFLEGSDDKRYLPHLLEKIEEDKTKTTLLINIHDLEQFYDVILEYKNHLSIFFLLIGDLYSEIPDFPKSEVSKIIENAIAKKVVELKNNDLLQIFPIYFKDAILGINQILFGSRLTNKIYYLFYSNPQTLISAIHLISRVEPDLQVSYEEKYREEKIEPIETIDNELHSKLLIKPGYLDRYFEGFEKRLRAYQDTKTKALNSEENSTIKKVERISKSLNFKFFTGSFLVAFVIYLILNAAATIFAFFYFNKAVYHVKRGEFSKVSESATRTNLFLNFIEPNVGIIKGALGFAGKNNMPESLEIFEEGINLSTIIPETIENAKKVVGGEREKLEQILSDATYLYFLLEKIQEKKGGFFDNLFKKNLLGMISLSSVAPQVLGFDEERKYLILFQNNGELRPTGGFIGSVGEAKIQKGKLVDFEIKDVYDLDGQLKAHIEPHYIIRRYLQPHLYLRDSNFDPDFERSASLSALLYNLETDKKVDGVIAVNFEAIRRIIELIGPIKLSSYNKMLDAQNTFEFLQTTIDKNFFPGSTEKKDLLQSLFNQLVLKLENEQEFLKTIPLIPDLLNEKHILFAFHKSSENQIFKVLGYTGSLTDFREMENTISDTLSINEANIGANKANVLLDRKVEYDVFLEEENIRSILKYRIINTKPNAKDYKAYLRIIVPADSGVKTIKIDGVKQNIIPAITDPRLYESPVFKSPKGLEVDRENLAGKNIFGFIVNVPKGRDQEIEVSYDNGTKTISAEILTYSLWFIKQSGTIKFPFVLRLHYPNAYAPKEVENAILEKNTIVIKEEINRDKTFEMKLIKR